MEDRMSDKEIVDGIFKLLPNINDTATKEYVIKLISNLTNANLVISYLEGRFNIEEGNAYNYLEKYKNG